MLKIMQKNLRKGEDIELQDENSNIAEKRRRMSDVSIDMNEESWREVFKNLLVIDNDKRSEGIVIDELVKIIISLNDSTRGLWWRGDIELDKYNHNI